MFGGIFGKEENMKKNDLTIAAALILVLSLLFACAIGMSRSLNDAKDKLTDTETSSETEKEELKDTVTIDTETNSTINIYSKLISETNSGDYHFCYVTHETDGYTMFGIYTTVLEPEKLHKIEWTINADMYDGELDIPWDTSSKGYRFYLNPDYQPYEGLGYIISPGQGVDFENIEDNTLLDNEISFTSAASGSTFSFLFARADVTDAATCQDLCDLIAENFSFKIYQLEE